MQEYLNLKQGHVSCSQESMNRGNNRGMNRGNHYLYRQCTGRTSCEQTEPSIHSPNNRCQGGLIPLLISAEPADNKGQTDFPPNFSNDVDPKDIAKLVSS